MRKESEMGINLLIIITLLSKKECFEALIKKYIHQVKLNVE